MANNLSQLDANQVLRSAYDDATNRLRVDSLVTATIGQIEVEILHTEDSIRLGDGTNLTTVNASGQLATEVFQLTHDNLNLNANLQVGNADVVNGNPVPISDAGGTITVDQSTHDNFNANANIQVANTDASASNPVPTLSQNVFALPFADFTALVEASTTDTWTFRDGGSGGSIVAVVVITYTDSSKATIANVERTT